MAYFAPVLALHIHEVSALVILAVGIVALALAVVGYRSFERSRNRALAFVVGAFGLLAGKGIIGAYAVWADAVPHEHLELLLALADLAIVLLLATPLILGSRRKAR